MVDVDWGKYGKYLLTVDPVSRQKSRVTPPPPMGVQHQNPFRYKKKRVESNDSIVLSTLKVNPQVQFRGARP